MKGFIMIQNKSNLYKFAVVFCITLFLTNSFFAQEEEKPRPSPKSSVMQVVGLTEVSITYSSPGVKDRAIWGELVPYDEPWRTGANEGSVITFSKDVKINGQNLAAGSYKLFTVPGESEWEVMFNLLEKNTGNGYKEEANILKVKTKPEEGKFLERMAFLIENNDNKNADIVLQWEKLRVVLKMEISSSM